MRGSSLVVAAMLAVVGAGTAQGQSESPSAYISECVASAVTQAQAAGDYSGYGLLSDSFCLLGGWITKGHMLQYTVTLQEGHSYLFVGAGDRDVKDLDLSVSDGTNTVEDTETDNTPFVHVQAESTVEVTITLTNFDGSGEPDFCSMIILEDEGGQANLSSLNQAATGLCQMIDKLGEEWETDKASDGSSWCLMGGLMGTGGALGLSRSFAPGTYVLVGWGDSRAGDVDASVADGDGEVVAADTENDTTPVVPFEVSGKAALSGTLNLAMPKAKGNAFAVCAVLKQK